VHRAFLASAGRNAAGSAAEFLPGLLLAPIVLAARGPEQAAYFGMAWTLASLLFLSSAAISRSALAALVGTPEGAPTCIRRATLQHLGAVAPAAVVLVALAPTALAIFGPGYASASLTLAVLALSVIVVAPSYVYLALLRARDRTAPLVAFPLAMILALAVLAPRMADAWGLVGVAGAWLAANVPFGIWAAWRLHQEVRAHEEVNDASRTVGGRAHVE
jgi:O-antigen/teichoic acid export membrane protein